MVADETPDSRDALAEGEEYTARHHSLLAVVNKIEEGDVLTVTRTSGKPAPAGELDVTRTSPGIVETREYDGTEWQIRLTRRRPDLDGKTPIAIGSDEGRTRLRGIAVVEKGGRT